MASEWRSMRWTVESAWNTCVISDEFIVSCHERRAERCHLVHVLHFRLSRLEFIVFGLASGVTPGKGWIYSDFSTNVTATIFTSFYYKDHRPLSPHRLCQIYIQTSRIHLDSLIPMMATTAFSETSEVIIDVRDISPKADPTHWKRHVMWIRWSYGSYVVCRDGLME